MMTEIVSDNLVEISVLAGATALGALAMITDSDMGQTVLTAVIAVYTLVAGFYWGRQQVKL